MQAFAIALLAAFSQPVATASPQPPMESSSEFSIRSREENIQAFPYPYTLRETTLTWNSPTPRLSYVLSDDGERVQATYSIGLEPDKCLGVMGPLQLERLPASLFTPDLFFSPGCGRAVPSKKNERLALLKVLKKAQSAFPAAYADFIRATKTQHGLSDRRCVTFGFGNHGPVCERYSDESK